jgi:hypothetical protein
MKDYYKILRVGKQASREEIKRAYRRLAVVFHPDKNPSLESAALFQEINEAHSILSDPDKRIRYDQLLSAPYDTLSPQPPPKWHRDPAYRRKQQPGYKPPPYRPSEKMLMMAHFLKYQHWVTLAGMAWCAILLLDYALPSRQAKETVIPESERVMSWEFHHVPNVVVTDKGHQFPVPAEGAQFFRPKSIATIVTSPLLNIPVRIEAEAGRYKIEGLATIYSSFIGAPVILLIMSLICWRMKTGIESRFNMAVSICIVLFFNALFLYFSIL